MKPIEGRMIQKSISRSKRFAKLSPDAQVLFCLLIAHYNSHGKQSGSPFTIKGEVVPFIERYTLEKIQECMAEINTNTDVKWFEHKGLWYIHSLEFGTEHQNLRESRLGRDLLPSYKKKRIRNLDGKSGTSPGQVQPEVEVEVEVEGEGEVEEKSTPPKTGGPLVSTRLPKEKPKKHLWQEMIDHVAKWWFESKGAKLNFTGKHMKFFDVWHRTYEPEGVMGLWDMWIQRNRDWSDWAWKSGRSIEGFASALPQLLDSQGGGEWKAKRQFYKNKFGTSAKNLMKGLKSSADLMEGLAK